MRFLRSRLLCHWPRVRFLYFMQRWLLFHGDWCYGDVCSMRGWELFQCVEVHHLRFLRCGLLRHWPRVCFLYFVQRWLLFHGDWRYGDVCCVCGWELFKYRHHLYCL